jgi:hypothetical protein
MLAPAEERDFLDGRAGDPLFSPFECDGCSFFKLKGQAPRVGNHADDLLQSYIRRANLDAFWSRRPSTVKGLVRLFKEQTEVGDLLGFDMFTPMGPFRREYNTGIGAAVGLLSRAQKAGRHEAKLKFSSARKARTVHTNSYQATARAIEGASVWRSAKTRFVATESPTDTEWFVRFMAGFHARVGERTKQDAAISVGVMLKTQELLQEEWAEAIAGGKRQRMREVSEQAAFFLFLYCGSLRGFEGPKVMLSELREQIVAPGTPRATECAPHIGLPLSGRFKAQAQSQQTILVLVAYATASGLQPGLWAERAIQCLEEDGITTGWVFQNADGSQKRMSDFEDKFYDLLLRARDDAPELFPEGQDVLEDYHLARSHRRGATSRATAAGVAAADIEWHNRWNIGLDQHGSLPMRVLYADKSQNIDTYLRFSKAL